MVQFGGKWANRLAGGFAHAEAISHGHIDDETGEFFLHQPMIRRPNWPQTEDPDRKILTIRASFFWEHSDQRLGMEEVKVATRKPKLIIMRCNLKQKVLIGDVFTRECDGTTFEAHAPEKDGLSGIEVCLTQLGRPY